MTRMHARERLAGNELAAAALNRGDECYCRSGFDIRSPPEPSHCALYPPLHTVTAPGALTPAPAGPAAS